MSDPRAIADLLDAAGADPRVVAMYRTAADFADALLAHPDPTAARAVLMALIKASNLSLVCGRRERLALRLAAVIGPGLVALVAEPAGRDQRRDVAGARPPPEGLRLLCSITTTGPPAPATARLDGRRESIAA
jgi:hypothetical protein